MAEKMHYFKSVEGHACRRYGSETFIGCTRGPKGYSWNTNVVVAIPETEMKPYRKDYTSCVRLGDLLRVDAAAYDEWLSKRKAASEAAASEFKAAQTKDDPTGYPPAEVSVTE